MRAFAGPIERSIAFSWFRYIARSVVFLAKRIVCARFGPPTDCRRRLGGFVFFCSASRWEARLHIIVTGFLCWFYWVFVCVLYLSLLHAKIRYQWLWFVSFLVVFISSSIWLSSIAAPLFLSVSSLLTDPYINTSTPFTHPHTITQVKGLETRG